MDCRLGEMGKRRGKADPVEQGESCNIRNPDVALTAPALGQRFARQERRGGFVPNFDTKPVDYAADLLRQNFRGCMPATAREKNAVPDWPIVHPEFIARRPSERLLKVGS